MGESDRTPLIRLEVDQEVFVDVVREQDEIEDATVATEVTSFDRVGDAYVLEGAIVFAGYLKRSGTETYGELDGSDALAFGLDQSFVQHVHHRMPFLLRVPVKAQPRGVVNVTSRISTWELTVIGAGWLRVVVDLAVVGLNGERGYHFQCGAQEVGDLFFEPVLEPVRGERPYNPPPEHAKSPSNPPEVAPSEVPNVSFVDAFSEARGGVPPEAVFEEQAAVPADPIFEEPEAAKPDVEVQRAAKQSQPTPQAQPAETVQPAPVVDAVQPQVDFSADESHERSQNRDLAADAVNQQPAAGAIAKDDLLNFDRVYGGPFGDANVNAWAEFEFTDQVNPVDVHTEDVAQPVEPPRREQFVPSRSFAPDGFRAAAGFAPDRVPQDQNQAPAFGTNRGAEPEELLRSQPQSIDLSQAWQAANDDDGTVQSFEAQDGGNLRTDTSLWSFVDFNAPEHFYTMRFVIVEDNEGLESVAARAGCSKEVLSRANRLAQDSVWSGQALWVP